MISSEAREKAEKLWNFPRNPGRPSIPEIAKALLSAKEEGRREGIEESAKVAEDRETFKIYPGFRRQDEIAKAIRNLLGGSK